MATPSIDQVTQLVREAVLRDDGTAGSILFLDTNKKVAQDNDALSFDPVNKNLQLKQAAATLPALKVTGKSTADVLTQTLVAGASVTTATKAAFVRVAVVDSNGVLTDGNYYIELFTIL